MTTEETIRKKLTDAFEPSVLLVENDSHRHAGPATDSHFNVSIVSTAFDGLTPVKRHQAVYSVLADELAGPVHALAIHAYKPEEWSGEMPSSPDCMGRGQ